jgi:hypothetical protein
VLVDNNNNNKNKKNGDQTVRLNNNNNNNELVWWKAYCILVRTIVKIPFSTALVVSLLRADVAFKNEKSFLLCHGWIVMIASDSYTHRK